MQLRLSTIACSLLAISSLDAQDYVSIQYMNYDEDSGRTTITTPAIEFNKDFGVDYTLNVTILQDTISGASPTYYDASSGASATLSNTTSYPSNIEYGDIEYEDEREAIGTMLTTRFASRDELSVGYNYSTENDYRSHELSLEYLHYLNQSKNSSFSFGLSYQKNDVEIYCFLGTTECDSSSGASAISVEKDLDVYNFEIGYTQILDKSSLVKGSLFMVDEDGYLSNPYMRVVRDYNTSAMITQENKPSSRRAYGATLQYDKALSNHLSSIVFYRFYDDDWDIISHTFDMKIYYTWNRLLMLGLNFRGYTQSAASFFNARRDYFTDEVYASSDRRVSEFSSYNYGLSCSYTISESITFNGGIGYYEQPNYFDAFYYNVGIKYNF